VLDQNKAAAAATNSRIPAADCTLANSRNGLSIKSAGEARFGKSVQFSSWPEVILKPLIDNC
jgi:hypothetical protein